MNKLFIMAFLALGFGISCTTTQKGVDANSEVITQKMVNNLTVSQLTWQELVSGVPGGKNMIVFKFNLDNNESNIKLDSLYYMDYACKLNIKNPETGSYVAQAIKSDNKRLTKDIKRLIFTIDDSDLQLDISELELKKLEPLHMP